jgi:prepilin-type N-terminal cleavage/methylation domain-containing protein
MRRNRNLLEQCGFSLVELMVVLVIVGLLMAIGLPVFLGAQARAQERQAQSRLHTGVEAALTHWTVGATFSPFDNGCAAAPGSCTLAEAAESSLAWIGNAAPSGDQVAIVVASGNNLLLVTRADSGEYFCISQATGANDRGRGAAFTDVDTVPECAGGW